MGLYAEYLVRERQTCLDHNVKLRHIGIRDGLPPEVIRELDESVRVTANLTGMTLCLALNYGGRAEILSAVQDIAQGERGKPRHRPHR